MRATKRLTPEQYTDRWLQRHGADLGPLSASTKDLLTNRLTARRHHLWIVLPIYLLTAVLCLFVTLYTPVRDTLSHLTDWGRGPIPGYAIAAFQISGLLTIIAVLWKQELDRQADRRLGAQLTHRITRGHTVSLRTVLGRRGRSFINAALIMNSMLVVALMASAHGWTPVFHFAAFAVVGLLAILSIRRALSRPTLAVDQTSIVLDERLRYVEVLNGAAIMVAFVALDSPVLSDALHPLLALLFSPIALVMVIMYYMAMGANSWQESGPIKVTATPSETTDSSS